MLGGLYFVASPAAYMTFSGYKCGIRKESYHSSGPCSQSAHIQSDMGTTTRLDVASTRTTIFAKMLMARPLRLDMLSVQAMELLGGAIHVEARNLNRVFE
jgi:hypothetical protein